jgi:cobalt-zinc-cadmium efflux system protein
METHKYTHSLSIDKGTDHIHHHVGYAKGGQSLVRALFLTFGFSIVEAVVGWLSGSLALISDAGHMLTDSTALGLAALAAWVARKPPTLKHSYGLVRIEILAALVNGMLMLGLIAFIASEAIDRFSQPRAVQGGAVMAVAALGLLVNLGVAWMLEHGDKTLNTRAALLHVMGDLLGSVAALIAGTVIFFTGWTPIDPILSLVVAVLILFSAWRLLREALHVLLEGVPEHIDLEKVGRAIAALNGVRTVHDLHVWTLSSGKVALSAHMELAALDHWPVILQQTRHLLTQRFGIEHVTLQPEVTRQGIHPLRFQTQHPRHGDHEEKKN